MHLLLPGISLFLVCLKGSNSRVSLKGKDLGFCGFHSSPKHPLDHPGSHDDDFYNYDDFDNDEGEGEDKINSDRVEHQV